VMSRPSAEPVLSLAILMLCALSSGCDSESQSVHIVAEDFRFTPDAIHLAGSRPIHLTLFNQGREFHEFESPLLSDPSVVIESVTLAGEARTPDHLRIAPGQRLEVLFRAPSGTYLFYCKVRGHSGMGGTFIVE
jgi:uncharacterized cupredoxin-like copper-binding protein